LPFATLTSGWFFGRLAVVGHAELPDNHGREDAKTRDGQQTSSHCSSLQVVPLREDVEKRSVSQKGSEGESFL
jgi:hypothetical protein